MGGHINRMNGGSTGAGTLSSSSSLRSLQEDVESFLSPESCTLTPPGYGFSAPASRLLSLQDDVGYTLCYSDELVPDIVARMFAEGGDMQSVALVSDREGKFVGIFTERDYVRWSSDRDAKDVEVPELLNFAKSEKSLVTDWCTPASDIVFTPSNSDASSILSAMKGAGIRHMVITASATSPSQIDEVEGVLSMSKIMSVIVNDERLSMASLTKKFPNLVEDPITALKEERKSKANELAKKPGVAKQDFIRSATTAVIISAVALFFSQSSWLHNHAELGMIGIFVLGYVGIIFEELFEFNKAGVALLMSTALWVTYADFYDSAGTATESVLDQLKDQLAEVSDICFFLLAASTIVEVVDAHQGFKVVTNAITTNSKKQLFWIIGFLTFFLSAILNNLTVTIVMVSLLRKIIPKEDDRRLFGAMVVVAANAGGVWTPIGDVTTTMLWINHQLSTVPTVTELFLPSVVCLVGSLAFLVGDIEEDDPNMPAPENLPDPSSLAPRGSIVFAAGIASLLAVPIFAELTGLPPYLAMLTGLGAMWTLTDAIHMGEEGTEREALKVPAALSKLDTSGILFFLGILMSIGVLDKAGLLKSLAVFLNDNLPGQEIIATVIGLASALIDNVPLVAATMGMYDLSEFGTDDPLWQLIALCAGTGGSILVIGSASGVALMGLEKVDFLWYAKNISIGATVGYFGGIATYLAQTALLKGGGTGLFSGGIAESISNAQHMLGVDVANAIDVVATNIGSSGFI